MCNNDSALKTKPGISETLRNLMLMENVERNSNLI